MRLKKIIAGIHGKIDYVQQEQAFIDNEHTNILNIFELTKKIKRKYLTYFT